MMHVDPEEDTSAGPLTPTDAGPAKRKQRGKAGGATAARGTKKASGTQKPARKAAGAGATRKGTMGRAKGKSLPKGKKNATTSRKSTKPSKSGGTRRTTPAGGPRRK